MSRGTETVAATDGILHLTGRCTGCGACVSVCPVRALTLASDGPGGSGRKLVAIDRRHCTLCGVCLPACLRQALAIVDHSESPP
jgi:ferredoxin